MRRSISASVRNNISGRTTQELCHRARAAGADGVGNMATAGKSGTNRNTARDVLRSLKKHSKMPPLYWAGIPMRTKAGTQVITQCPFLLPSEVLAALYSEGEMAGLCDFSEGVRNMLDTTCKALGISADGVIPLGIHGDGVPNQASKTVVCFSWNVLAGPASERILFTAIDKDSASLC